MSLRIIDERVLEKIRQLVRNLYERSKELVPKPADAEWLDNQEARLLLDVSPRTLQSYRDRGVLPYSQIGHKCYYKLSDIKQLLEKSRISNKHKNTK